MSIASADNSTNSEADWMQFNDWRNDLQISTGTGQWISVYKHHDTDNEHIAFFSALVSLKKVRTLMKNPSWDLHIGDGKPGCSSHSDNGVQVVEYHRFGDDNVEPLIFVRSFYGAAPSYLEVSEEFRLFHDLFWDSTRNTLIAYDESGDPSDVVEIKSDEVLIRSIYLKRYLAIRDLALLLYFDLRRYTKTPLARLGVAKAGASVVEPDLHYIMRSGEIGPSQVHRSFTRLLGKKLVRGMEKEKCGIWPYTEAKKYADYVIQRGLGKEPEICSANPDQLANYFGANAGAPHYLTPVFFRREVLNKYYANPERYSVEDGYLRASSQWGMQIDNNHPSYVVAFLGDLGRDLPYKDQLYWKSFNIEPAGEMSEVNFRRSILGQPTSPTRPDLLFKQQLENFNKDWQDKFGWVLFKQLSRGDKHLLVTLRVPLSDTQAEFDSQVLAICKLLIDSLNEAELVNALTQVPDDAKGMSKLSLFLEANGVNGAEPHIKFLRNLWNLRHGTGHRKGVSYESAARVFQLQENGFITTFEMILVRAMDFLRFLRVALLDFDIDGGT